MVHQFHSLLNHYFPPPQIFIFRPHKFLFSASTNLFVYGGGKSVLRFLKPILPNLHDLHPLQLVKDPLSFFSALCDFFFEFFLPSKDPPSSFDILQQTKVPKSPKGLLFYVFRHYETVQNSHFSFFFRKLKKTLKKKSKFYCLRRVPPSICLIFCNKLDFQKARRVTPFTGLKPLRFLSLRYSADFRRSRLVLRQTKELTLYVPLFVHFYHKYSVLDFERIESL